MSQLVKLILSVFILISFSFADTLYSNSGAGDGCELIVTDSRSITVEFNLKSLDTEEAGSGSILRIPGEGLSAVPGFPDMPVLRRMIQVSNTGTIGYEILDSESFVIDLPDYIIPFQPLPIRGEPRVEERVNSEFYGGSLSWPQSSVTIESVEILRDIRIARVSFIPASTPSAMFRRVCGLSCSNKYLKQRSNHFTAISSSNSENQPFLI